MRAPHHAEIAEPDASGRQTALVRAAPKLGWHQERVLEADGYGTRFRSG
jgi:hypothetical protein